MKYASEPEAHEKSSIVSQALETIRINLKEEIKNRGLSVMAVERKANITQGLLSKFLSRHSHSASFDTIYASVKALGLTIDQLLGSKPNENKPEVIKAVWDYNLFAEVMEYVHNRIPHSTHSAAKMVELILDIYTFSAKNKTHSFKMNTDFADWYIEKVNSPNL